MIYVSTDNNRPVSGADRQSPNVKTSSVASKDLKFDLKTGKREWIDRPATPILDEKIAPSRENAALPPIDGKQ